MADAGSNIMDAISALIVSFVVVVLSAASFAGARSAIWLGTDGHACPISVLK